MTLHLDLLRHGETELGGGLRGSLDDALTANGWAQMRAAVVGQGPWDRLISSPLQRCALFADEVAQRCNKPLSVMDGFREVDFGDWEGRLIDEVWREQGSNVRRFFSDPVNAAPPNGEPMRVFERRVLAAWNQLLQTLRGEHVLLVAHGGTIRILLAHVLAMPLNRIANLEVPYASASRIRIHHSDEHDDFSTLIFHNSQF